jgi:ribonuclease P protein component
LNFRFTWNERLHRRGDFSLVIKTGRRFSTQGLVIWVYRHTGSDQPPRMGLAIPRAYGNAVARNRLKRLLREVFRLNKAALPRGADMVFSAGRMPPRLRFQTVEPLVKLLWNKAGLTPRPD